MTFLLQKTAILIYSLNSVFPRHSGTAHGTRAAELPLQEKFAGGVAVMPRVLVHQPDTICEKAINNKETRVIMSEWPVDVKPLVDFDKNIGLIWSAKSACSLSVLWFFAVTGHIQKAWAHDQWPHAYRGEVFNELQFIEAQNSLLVSSDTRWVRVMRDPFKRAVSSYRHFLLHDLEREQATDFLGTPVDKRGISFEEFLSYVETRDINKCDIHIRQQWAEGEESCLNTKTINADTENLESVLFSFMRPDENSLSIFSQCKDWMFPFHNAKIEENFSVSSKTIIRKDCILEKWPGFSAFDNARTRENVRKIYHQDYERFERFI